MPNFEYPSGRCLNIAMWESQQWGFALASSRCCFYAKHHWENMGNKPILPSGYLT